MRFSRQDGANDISLDPVRSTSKFALRACTGQDDPGDTGELSNILHLTHPFSKFRDRWTLELIAFRWTPKLRVIEGCILHGKKHWVFGRNIHTVGRDRTIGLF